MIVGTDSKSIATHPIVAPCIPCLRDILVTSLTFRGVLRDCGATTVIVFFAPLIFDPNGICNGYEWNRQHELRRCGWPWTTDIDGEVLVTPMA